MIEALSDSLSCLRSQFMSTLSTSSSSSTNSTSSLDEISKGFRNFFFHFHRFGQKGEYEPTFRKMKDSVNRTLLLGSCIDVGFNIWMCGENERGENVALTDLWTKRMAENLKGMEKKQEFIHHLFFIHHFIDYESRRFEDFKKIKFYNGISHNYRILGNLISAHLGNIIEFASSFNSHSFSLLEKKFKHNSNPAITDVKTVLKDYFSISNQLLFEISIPFEDCDLYCNPKISSCFEKVIFEKGFRTSSSSR